MLDREIFYTLTVVLVLVLVLVKQYRQVYNQIRPHNSLGYRLPAPQAILPAGPSKMLF